MLSQAPTPPLPCTTLNTPQGRPAVVKTSARMFAVRGVTSDGLKMKVFPAARAGAHFQSALEIQIIRIEISNARIMGQKREEK